MGGERTNAERQRRYIARLKARADAPHSPDIVLEALARLKPVHFLKGTVETFAKRIVVETERLAPGVTNASVQEVDIGQLPRPLTATLLRGRAPLADKLIALIEDLAVEASKNQVTMSVSAVAALTHHLDKLLVEHKIIPPGDRWKYARSLKRQKRKDGR
jgi:hypothetical protein